MEQRNIQVTDEQDAFLKDQRQAFNFSKFVRAKLDEYIELLNKKEVKNNG